MFDNVALNVVLGLIFIYLLYSLLATIIAEIIATQLGIRALNLMEAVNRMLSDNNIENDLWKRFKDSMRLRKKPNSEVIKKFYNNPEIKYLGSTGIFANPSSFKAETFSRTLLFELNGSGPLDRNGIETELSNLVLPIVENPNTGNAGVSNNKARTLDQQSAQFVLSLLRHSNGDLDKFKVELEAWFDRTMEQATEWYKRKIQVILFVIGFMMAWFFNAGTFTIVDKLATDKDAREQLVSMANAYVQNNPRPADIDTNTKAKLDTLLAVKKKLEVDIAKANSILGAGSWIPATVKVTYDKIENKNVYVPNIDKALLKWRCPDKIINGTKIYISNWWDQLGSFLSLFILHFGGFFITAIAISLGAPFWYDILNKVMRLRTSLKQPLDSTGINTDKSNSPQNRIG